MSVSIRMKFEELRTVAFGGLSANYAEVGTPLEHPARMILVQNLTDALLLFSTDGVTDHFVLPASGFMLLDLASNREASAQVFAMAKGEQLWVKETVADPATQGDVYFTVIYGYQTTLGN